MSSIGFIETKGLTGSLEAADAMLKAARVSLTRRREIGSALVTVMIEGELGAVQAAVEAGAAAAERLGQLVSAHVIARPFEDTVQWLGIPQQEPEKAAAVPPVPSKTQKQSSPGTTVKRTRKKAVPQKNIAPVSKSTTDADSDRLLSLLQAAKDGMTLEALAAATGRDKKAVRVALKELLDHNRIEKVKNLYFPL